MDVDPDRVFHQDAIEMVQAQMRKEQRWLVQLQKEKAAGYDRDAYIEKQQLIVKSLSEMAGYAAERRMLATIRWIFNGAAAARVADKNAHPWAGLPEDAAVAVRAAVRAGKVLRTEHVPARFGVATDLKLIEFTDPELGQRWAVSVTMVGERYLTDHPTEFDANTRFSQVLTAAGGVE